MGVEQRMGGSLYPSAPPSFDAVPSAQPILPCLLRHLLIQKQEGALAKAVALARASQARPHFLHSLEWLLFTALEAQSAAARQRRKRGGNGTRYHPNHFVSSQLPCSSNAHTVCISPGRYVSPESHVLCMRIAFQGRLPCALPVLDNNVQVTSNLPTCAIRSQTSLAPEFVLHAPLCYALRALCLRH